MKIVVTGSSGLLGGAIVERALARGHEVIALYGKNAPRFPVDKKLTFRSFDLADFSSLDRLLLEQFPEVIINAAAISNPTGVDADPVLSEKINVALPERLAQLAFHVGGRFFHFSTDMVFNGLRKEPYFITDEPSPSNRYGEQKVSAERAVLRAAAEHSTILRIPILTGNSLGGARSVHEKILHALADGETPRLFTDELRQPTSAENVAQLVVELIERDPLTGIFHWVGKENISRYEMGRAILEHFGLPESLIALVQKSDDPAFANRPSSLLLNCQVLEGKVRTPRLSFAEQLSSLRVPQPLQSWYHKKRENGQ